MTGTAGEVVIGVDIGGTKTAAAVVSFDPMDSAASMGSFGPTAAPGGSGPGMVASNGVEPGAAAFPGGRILRSARTPTPAADGGAAVLEAALRLAAAEVAWAQERGLRVTACGVGSAGTIGDDGVVTHATDALPGWRGTDLPAAFGDRLGVPVTVLNDVHAWALGESRFGAARGSRLALVLTIGTGIGGAIVRDGHVLTGGTGTAGSLGHVPAALPPHVPATRPCPCGRPGHLEAYASGPAILSTYRQHGGTAHDLRDMARDPGDELARDVIHEAALILGRTIGGAATLLDPDVIVLGGGVTALGDRLTAPLVQAARQEALPGPDAVPIRTTALGRHGAVLGAAASTNRLQTI
ncbi:ROK family protein [Nonomuraea purpurea]|uniref:ROK family protein n=1 Tax=Nonomuraea purpurea TaxID=1849276 RepID=A0ABV8GMT0_9ACTN